MKNRASFFIALLACNFSAPAAENPYDAIAKMLAPFVQLFAKEAADHAMSADFLLLEMTAVPREFTGAAVSVKMQTPDKLRVSSPVLGVPAVICRAGDEVWISPGAQIEALLKSRGDLPALDAKEKKLGAIELPIPSKQLVFLPALLHVSDVSETTIGGQPCRVLDITLMPELARSLNAQQWAARVWLRADHTPARITLARQGWHIAVDVLKIEFAPSLPPETWQPTPDQSSDLLRLDAPRVRQLMKAAAQVFRLAPM